MSTVGGQYDESAETVTAAARAKRGVMRMPAVSKNELEPVREARMQYASSRQQ